MISMKRILTGLVSLALAGAVAGCGGGDKAAQRPDDGQGEKPIVIGLDDNFPPMGFRDENNEIVGFDIDLAKELSKRIGVPVEFKAIDWSSKEAEIASGRIDAIWNGLEITEERKKNLLFSEPYMNNRLLIFRRAKDENIKAEADLAGKVVATQSGSSTAEDYVDGNAAKFSDTKKYPEYLSAFMDLEAGRIDAVICDEIIGRYYMSKHPDSLAAVDESVGPVTQYGIGYKLENTELKEKFQKVLDEMRADGTLAKISEKWFGKDITKL